MHTRIAMTAAILIFAGATAVSQPEPPKKAQAGEHPGMMHQKMERDEMDRGDAPMHRLMEELQLTDAQKTELKSLRAEMEKAMVKSQAEIKTARIDLRQLVLAEKPDRGAIEKKIKEISAFQHEAKMTLVNHLFSVNAKLTPEQQKKFRDHMAAMLMEERGGMRMGGGPGMMRHNMGR